MGSVSQSDSAATLERLYEDLGFDDGTLLSTVVEARDGAKTEGWERHGEWLLLAGRIGAEKVYFVEDDPVVIFSSLAPEADDDALLECYRRAWSMARPRYLFVARGDEIRVYALSAPPAKTPHEKATIEPLEVVQKAGEAARRLKAFHRERIDHGDALDSDMTSGAGRADQQLIRDVQRATNALDQEGLSRRTAHALIERVILIRYLEDRKVLVPEYFADIASANPTWAKAATGGSASKDGRALIGAKSTFAECLDNKALTYEFSPDLPKTSMATSSSRWTMRGRLSEVDTSSW